MNKKPTSELDTIRINVQGIVQGVGFRPFIYNLARTLNILGSVCNTSAGVIIIAQAHPEILNEFTNRIKADAPALSRIEQMVITPVDYNLYASFDILPSKTQPGNFSLIPPDIATCPDCLQEMFDPEDRRYRYPFINCTNCGPRFSIIERMPYDRPYTAMAKFQMCPECLKEYEDPTNRRFHAQPIACPVCGPKISFYQDGNMLSENEVALQQARQLIRSGGILALKGIGGYQLVCDAFNSNSITKLRQGKLRSNKPFALMAHTNEIVSKYAQVYQQDLRLLSSFQSPILILDSINSILENNAPNQHTLGFMLPYTPLHYLITETEVNYPEVLVMTSGNISDEPMVIDDQLAFMKLADMADAFLSHNRPIINRVDDSVYRSNVNGWSPVRRSRGYAPDPVTISSKVPPVFAAGALLKNTFAITKDDRIMISQYLGDLDNQETYFDYRHSVNNYFNLFQFEPKAVACDLHPDYLSTSFAEEAADKYNVVLSRIQHHHAHLAACLAENMRPLDETIAGLIFDGTGYGSDGAIWGGEYLLGNASGFERRAHIQYLPLPGGDAATKKPYRIALAYLHALGIPLEKNLPAVIHCPANERSLITAQLEKNVNVFPTSSVGRLFDAISALLGVRMEASYEGQAAIELEAITDPNETSYYLLDYEDGVLMLAPLFKQVIWDMQHDVEASTIASRFHNTLIYHSCKIIQHIISGENIKAVALSGGVWQNAYLLTRMPAEVRNMGLQPLLHTILPPNDGCISLGQAVIAGFQQIRKK